MNKGTNMTIADHEFYNAIYNRIMNRHPELVDKYGPVNVWGAVDQHAQWLETLNLEEIGSSDISAWVNDITRSLEALEQFNLLEGV